ncbi:MAG: nucleotidyltransferase family protein, partial [Clostridia bacterium]|nr:nucleotidyltransferase family protein [Clostridia bacterium]
MRVAGIICEYNPFHNGHRYHIQKTLKQADRCIC